MPITGWNPGIGIFFSQYLLLESSTLLQSDHIILEDGSGFLRKETT